MRKIIRYAGITSAAALALSLTGAPIALADDGPKPPAPVTVQGKGPKVPTKKGWKLHPSQKTHVAKPCRIITRAGADMDIKTTGVYVGPGQIVHHVAHGVVNPSGNVLHSAKWSTKVGPGTWRGALHLPRSSRPGNWSAYSQADIRGTDSQSLRYSHKAFCVRKNAYAGYIRLSDDSPYDGQKVTASVAYMGLNLPGTKYYQVPRYRITFHRLIGGVWTVIGDATTNSKGVASKTFKYTGGPGEVAVSFAGNGWFRSFASDSVLIG